MAIAAGVTFYALLALSQSPITARRSYRGSGRLAGRKALITSGDSRMAALPQSPSRDREIRGSNYFVDLLEGGTGSDHVSAFEPLPAAQRLAARSRWEKPRRWRSPRREMWPS